MCSAMRFAICNEIFQGWKIDDVFTYAAKIEKAEAVARHRSRLRGRCLPAQFL